MVLRKDGGSWDGADQQQKVESENFSAKLGDTDEPNLEVLSKTIEPVTEGQ